MFSRILARASAAAALVMLAACGTAPSTIHLPRSQSVGAWDSAAQKYAEDPDEAKYEVATTIGRSALSKLAHTTVLPLEKTRGGALAQIKAHQVEWQRAADGLAASTDFTNNLGFAGAVIGAAGVIRDSLEIGRIGAGIAGGAGVWSDRYKLAVQADNYRRGAEAMQCMAVQITALPADFWSMTYHTSGGQMGEMKLPRGAFKPEGQNTPEEVNQGYDKLQNLFTDIHNAVADVRKRLGTAQRKVSLASPSAAEIASAIRGSVDAQTESENAGRKMNTLLAGNKGGKGGAQGFSGTERTAVDAAQISAETFAKALRLPQSLTTCVAILGQ